MTSDGEGASAPPRPVGKGATVHALALRKATQAWELRTLGHSWDEVAAIVGYSNRSNCLRAVRRLRGTLPQVDVEELRAAALERLHVLLRQAIADVQDRRPSAVTHQVRVEQRISQLLGLDKPTQIEVYAPTSAELERWVAGVLAHTVPDVVEADVIGELDAPAPGELEAAG